MNDTEEANTICNPVLKDQVCNSEEYKEIENKQHTHGLLRCIKKMMYSNREDDNHVGYNHMIPIIIYYQVQQERHHSLQEYHDQFTAYRSTHRNIKKWC